MRRLLASSKALIGAAFALSIVHGAADARELRFWTSETAPERISVIAYLMDVFGALSPDIEVRVTNIPDQQLLERYQAAGRDERPHLIHTGGEFLGSLGVAGVVSPRSASLLVDRIGRAEFAAGALSVMMTPGQDGMVWGVPFHGWIQGIWYRQDWFEEKGLAPPTNWEAIEAAARALHDPDAGRYGILLGTGEDTYAEQVFQHLALSNSVQLFDADGGIAFDSTRTTETLEFVVRLSKYAPPDATGWRGRDYFLQGRLGMMFYSTFIMDDLALPSVAANSLGTENFSHLSGAAFDPELVHNTRFQATIQERRIAAYGSIAGLGIAAGLSWEDQRNATRLVAFLTRPDTYVAWLHMAPGGMFPVRRTGLNSDAFLRDPQRVFVRFGRARVMRISQALETVGTLAQTGNAPMRLTGQIFDAAIIPRMVYRAVHEGVPPARAVADAAEEMRRLSAEN